ncbi:MAG TPA: class I SAM-dependent methyltransferase, partial [Burkholderiales bacterium]|nr:class I SAM-dependent methyltransferase [Burkholderiales bacterium]
MFRAIPKGIVSALAAALFALAPAAYAQQKDFKPHVGQQGKDVVWVPTPDEVVERMLNMAQTKPEDYVIDLGAGDGKIAIAAAKKFGARSTGIEYNPDMAALAQRNAQAAGVGGKAQIVQGDIFVSDFTQATVLTMYLLPSLNMKLRPQILAMRPGTRVVTHAFNMEDWEPDESSDVDGRRVYLWIVPANVSGRWAMEHSGAGGSDKLSLNLDQKFQRIEGVAYLGSI